MAAKKKGAKRGPKKGVPKPYKRPLDPDFRTRLLAAMKRRGFWKPDETPNQTALADEAKCEKATIGQYLNADKPRKTVDAPVLLDVCDALSVTPYWLLRNEGTIEDVPLHKVPLQEVRRKRPETR